MTALALLSKEEQKEYESWLDSTNPERECPHCGDEGVIEMQPMYADDPNAGRKRPCICQE